METPQPCNAPAAKELAFRIKEHRLGDMVPFSHSWLSRTKRRRGEVRVRMAPTKAHLLFRNKLSAWPGFFVSGFMTHDEAVVVARDTTLNTSQAFSFFEALVAPLNASRFAPSVAAYHDTVCYEVRYAI